MLRLMLLRHAQAVGPSTDDFNRPLAPAGREQASRMADYLAEEHLIPDCALVSDALRTQETAQLALARFAPLPLTLHNEIYTGDTDEWLALLRSQSPSHARILLVGHNPTCHALALLLTGYGDRYAAQRMRQDFPPCGLAVLDFDVEDWSDIDPHKARLDQFTVLQNS